jgi:osmoprotectant transport system permease protein
MRHKRLGLLFLGVSTSLQTIPSLALLVLFVPLFGIGQRPALVALFFYGLLPILRSSLLGFSRIDAGYKDAARSLGANPWQLFCKIELWLAMPAILSGLRTTFVINTGTATLGAFIGAGGLGVPIMQGLRLNDHVLVIKGALLAIGLAFTIEGFFYLLTRTVLPKPLR